MSETVGRPTKGAFLPTAALLVGAVYCLIPVFWLISASTKTAGELASTFTLWPSFNGGFQENLIRLFQFNDGEFFRWTANSIIYSVGGAALCTIVSAAAGYGLAKYTFRGKNLVFNLLLIGVLIPGVILAIPQYLLLSEVGIAGTYWSVLLPSIISPFSIYLARIYAAAVIPMEMIEAGRLDGASEWRIFRSVGLPPMVPGLITIFLLQFVGDLEQLPAAVHHAQPAGDVPAHRRIPVDDEPGDRPAERLQPRDHGLPSGHHPA